MKTWLEEIKTAFQELGGIATYEELYDYLETHVNRQLTPQWKATVRREIENHSSESHNYTERYDLFYPVHGINSRSGIWGLKALRDTQTITEETLDTQATQLSISQAFDPLNVEDARKRTVATIVQRRGQRAFRAKLLEAYSGCCAITGTNVEAVLEAAHIRPYKGPQTNHISNGILLRGDIHTLFDLRLLSVNIQSLSVVIAPILHTTDYGTLHNSSLKLPVIPEMHPNLNWLQIHRSECHW